MRQVELFYDFRSPYGYLAFTQLRAMDVALVLRPMQVLKVMALVGNTPTSITCAAKGRYARQDLARWARRYGVPFNPSNMRDNDGDACARAVLAGPDDAETITAALYRAGWSEAKPLTNQAEILAALTAAGIDAGPIGERMDSPAIVAQLDANTDEAAKRGVFGSPTVFVGEAMFFGNDRLDFVREHLDQMETAA